MTTRRVKRSSKPRKRVRRTAALSKQQILKAAIAEFALKGLDGARVDEIARRSGINKTLLYHHVGNKDRLFTAALEHDTARPALAHFGRAIANEGLGNVRAAYRDYREASTLSPRWSLPRTELARFRVVDR